MSRKNINNDKPDTQPDIRDNPLARLPEGTRTLLVTVMEHYNIRENQVSNLWLRSVPMDDDPGIISIVTLSSDIQGALVNASVIPRVINDHILTFAEVMQLFLALGDMPGDAQVGVGEKMITIQLYIPVNVPDTEAAKALDTLQEGLWKMRADLQEIVNTALVPGNGQPQPVPDLRLPKIKIYPKDMEVILNILALCHDHAQDIFLSLMEGWDRQGGVIKTTGTSICLDMPYGDRQTRLAILLPSMGKKQPVIGLFWDSLKRLDGLTREAIQDYFNTVENLTSLQKTESTAYIEVTQEFTKSKARALLSAMKALAETVLSTKIKSGPVSKPRTEPNMEATLKACPPEWAQAYTSLIEGWRKVGGIVHCPSAGRIYLRFKTRQHQTGSFSRLPHQFNLLVLAAPKGKNGCQIDIANGLATGLNSAYLDCIPEEVNQFERGVSSLPGYAKEGTVTRINLRPGFGPEDFHKLLNAMLALKIAEEKAD